MQSSRVEKIEASASYKFLRNLPIGTTGQAINVELVERVPAGPFKRLSSEPRPQFVRKLYPATTLAEVSKYLRSEYRILRELQHPNIVQYADFEQKQKKGKWQASLYMEYCGGGDLSSYTSKPRQTGKSLSEKQFWQVFCQLASALLYCQTGVKVDEDLEVTVDRTWTRSVLHRDIKPSNGTYSHSRSLDTYLTYRVVVISSITPNDVHVKICDFGLAKYDASTFLGSMVGTKGYMAPEILEENCNWTSKADIYSLGKTMQRLNCPGLSATAHQIINRCICPAAPQRISSVDLFDLTCQRIHSEVAYNEERICSLLIQEVYKDNFKVANRFLQAGADVNAAVVGGSTALHCTALRGNLEFLKCLQAAGADSEAVNEDGMTALHIAAYFGHLDIVNYLLGFGLDPNLLSNSKKSPFHLAAHRGRLDIMKAFLQASGNPWLLDGFGRSALDWTSTYPPARREFATQYRDYCVTSTQVTNERREQTIRDILQTERRECFLFAMLGRLLLRSGHQADGLTALKNERNCFCDLCNEPVHAPRYVCRTCADTDLCEECFGKYNKGEYIRSCRNHKFLEVQVPDGGTSEELFIDAVGETFEQWLHRLRDQWQVERDMEVVAQASNATSSIGFWNWFRLRHIVL